MNINIYGMNLNTMTSSALTTYGVQLKKRITELQSRQANKTISKDEKKELDASARILDVVASQNKRLITIDAKLKKNGINLGSIKNLTLTSMTKNGIDAIDKKLEIFDNKRKAGKITKDEEKEEAKLQNLKRYLTTSSKSGALAQRGATGIVAFNAVEDALKVTGTGLAIGAAYQVVASAAEAIGNIPVGNELVGEIVKDWIKVNMPWLGSAVGLAIAGGACLFIAKKMKEHKMAKNMGYAGAQEAQLEAEEKMIKEQKEDSKNVTLDTLAARAETDPQYLETLKSTLGGRGVDEIIAAGPDSTSVTATEYNAARIIKKVQARAAQQTDVKEARSNVNISNKLQEINNLDTSINNIDKEISNKQSDILNAENNIKEVNRLKREASSIPPYAGSNFVKDNADKTTDNKAKDFINKVRRLNGETEFSITETLTNDAFGVEINRCKNLLNALKSKFENDKATATNEISNLETQKTTAETEKRKKIEELNELQARSREL